MKKLACLLSVLLFVIPCLAWDGYDYDRNSYIDISRGTKVRTGRQIEYFDYGTGQYHTAEVESMIRHGSSVEIEVYDHDTGTNRTFEME